MKKVLLLLTLGAIFSISQASTNSTELPVINANNVIIPIGSTGKTVTLMDLTTITIKDYETLSGRKLSAFDKLGFKLGQKKLNKKISQDGTIKGKSLRKYATKLADGESGFHIGGFALGFFLGLIGVLIAYIINDDYKKNRVKWAWIGLGVIVVLSLILVAAAL